MTEKTQRRFDRLLHAMVTRPEPSRIFRHPEAAAKRPSKETAEALRAAPFEARRFAPSTSG